MGKVNLDEDNVFQEIDFKKDLGIDISNSPALKQAFAQKIIDRIVSRTLNSEGVIITSDGKVRAGRDLSKEEYSDEYVESDEFKAFGKQEGNVNMKLTGDMLGTVDVLEVGENDIKIGWNDPEENAKAFNHNTGDTVPKRQFFGISRSELEEIKSDLRPRIEALRQRENRRGEPADAITARLIRELEDGQGPVE